MRGLFGRMRDGLLWAVVNKLYDRALPGLNRLRQTAGVPAFRHVAQFATNPRAIISYTAEPFEYARAWPEGVHSVSYTHLTLPTSDLV